LRRRTDRKPRLESLERRWVLNYSITNVGPAGTYGAIPALNGLNNNGAAISTSLTASSEFLEPGGIGTAFVHRHGKLVDLGTFGNMSEATGINDQGTIVGISNLYPRTTSTQYAVFIYLRGRMTELAPIVNGNASAFTQFQISINNRGEVTGFPTYNGDDLLLKNGKLIDIGSLSGNGSAANDLSNSGEVVGSSLIPVPNTSNEFFAHAFAYSNGRMKDLGTLSGGSVSEADGVNDQGAVVGSSEIAGGSDHPFLYKNGTMTDLGTLGGPNGFAHSINDRGVIVGSADVPSGVLHAFVYKNGVMTDLNSLIPSNSGYVLVRGLAINNKGQILAEAYAENAPYGPFAVLLNSTKASG